jgi:hypothetical protein
MKKTLKILQAAIVIGLLSLCATPVLAQAATSTVVTSFPITPPAPEIQAAIESCVGEPVDFKGSITSVAHETDDRMGGVHVAMTFIAADASAVGENTGTVYRGPGQFQTKFNVSGPPPLEFTNFFNVSFISPGSGPNFTLRDRFHVTINANGDINVTVDELSAVCK